MSVNPHHTSIKSLLGRSTVVSDSYSRQRRLISLNEVNSSHQATQTRLPQSQNTLFIFPSALQPAFGKSGKPPQQNVLPSFYPKVDLFQIEKGDKRLISEKDDVNHALFQGSQPEDELLAYQILTNTERNLTFAYYSRKPSDVLENSSRQFFLEGGTFSFKTMKPSLGKR